MVNVYTPAEGAVNSKASSPAAELPQLGERRGRVEHAMVDGAAAVGVHLEHGRHLETGARCERGGEHDNGPKSRHAHNMPQNGAGPD